MPDKESLTDRVARLARLARERQYTDEETENDGKEGER